MSVDIQVPRLAESISDAVLVEWLREDGATVRTDEPIATLETDKAAVEIAASGPGVLKHARTIGERVHVGDVLARIEPGGNGSSGAAPKAPAGVKPAAASAPTASAPAAPSAPSPAKSGQTPTAPPAPTPAAPSAPPTSPAPAAGPLSPAVRRLVEEHRLDPATLSPSGRGGRLVKEDVLRYLESGAAAPPPLGTAAPAAGPTSADSPSIHPDAGGTTAAVEPASPAPPPAGDDERVVPMSRIRQRIAERLVRAQHTAAILTTFNELDMSAVLELRARWKDAFEKRHGVKLGFMSLFTRACVLALEDVPELNAEIRGTDIVYRRRVHMGIAVGTERGLVVPVVRDAQARSLAEIERELARLAGKAREGTLTIDELAGGTFTISNGGVYGSLMSTPILNPPQSGILGMHKIEKRPIAVDDQVVVRPMMYLALSYDHRVVDGEQAVTFLVRVKERLEDPERMLLEL